MNRKTKTEKNYKMFIAGQERTIPFVQLTESRFGDKYLIQDDEFKRISFHVAKEIILSRDLLTLTELEFLKATFKLNQNEVAKAIQVSESALSKWKISRKESGLDLLESLALKSYFKMKLIETTRDISSSTLLIDLIMIEIRNNFITKGGINVETFRDIDNIVLKKLVNSEFDVGASLADEAKLEQAFDLDVSSYMDETGQGNEVDYKDDYLNFLSNVG